MKQQEKTNGKGIRILLVSPEYRIETIGSESKLIKNDVEVESFDVSLVLNVILRIAKEIGGGAE